MELRWAKKLRKNMKKARKIPRENDEGNIEYKWKICNSNNMVRIERLITQIKFRLNEGNGRAVYNLGYTDGGVPRGISHCILYDNMKLFHNMVMKAGGDIISVKMMRGDEGFCANIFITRRGDNEYDDFLDDFYNHNF